MVLFIGDLLDLEICILEAGHETESKAPVIHLWR
jgi:hypothetical protein